jgi:hypothetical protein
VGQTGRYLAIGYTALGLGVGALVRSARRRGAVVGGAAVILVTALVTTDYAFRPVAVSAPASPIPSGSGRVLDTRLNGLHSAVALYYQMHHQRPLVGGYIARLPEYVRRGYEASPPLRWLFGLSKSQPLAPPTCDELRNCLLALDVRCVTVNSDSPQQQLLEACGWRTLHADEWGTTLTSSASDPQR